MRAARRVLQLGAVAVVLAADPTDLRSRAPSVPKELICGPRGRPRGLARLRASRRLALALVDALLAGYLAVSAVAALRDPDGSRSVLWG